MNSPVRPDDPFRVVVSLGYALLLLAIPGFVLFLRLFAYSLWGDPWSTPMIMPPWYSVIYFCVLAAAVFVIPFALPRGKAFVWIIIAAMILSLAGCCRSYSHRGCRSRHSSNHAANRSTAY